MALTGRNTALQHEENHLVTSVWRPRNPSENILCFQRDRVVGPYGMPVDWPRASSWSPAPRGSPTDNPGPGPYGLLMNDTLLEGTISRRPLDSRPHNESQRARLHSDWRGAVRVFRRRSRTRTGHFRAACRVGPADARHANAQVEPRT